MKLEETMGKKQQQQKTSKLRCRRNEKARSRKATVNTKRARYIARGAFSLSLTVHLSQQGYPG